MTRTESNRRRRLFPGPFLGIVLVSIPVLVSTATGAPPTLMVPPDHARQMARGLELFKSRVRPLLTQHCVNCHGGEKTKGALDLTTHEALLRGGAEGAAIVPGNAKTSRLYKLITHAEQPHMPHKAAKLPDPAIAAIAAWIDTGAPYDKPLLDKGLAVQTRTGVTEEQRRFWSFQALRRQIPPPVRNEGWCRTPLDRFVLGRLEAKGLTGNPPVERRRLIRRVYFDLLGLPPTPAEVEAFVMDPDPDAYEKVIDRLLASPHYGERWSRHWLDLARFAESHGYEQDYDRPSAYHYRDFVIQAFNRDMPYDQFVQWQIAGDELAPEQPLALMATGYLGAGTHATQITANQVEKERYDELDDMAATIGTSLLGLTIGCARCHDHKFDPIPTGDYYRLVSTFTTTVRSEIDLDLQPERYRLAKAAFDQQHAPLAAARERFEKERLPARLEQWLKTGPRPPQPPGWVLDPVRFLSKGGAAFTRQDDGSYRFETNPGHHIGRPRTPEQMVSLLRWYRARDPEWRQLDRAVQEHLKRQPRPQTVKVMVTSEGVKPIRLNTQGADFFDKTYFLKRGDLAQKEGEAPAGFLQVLMRTPDQEKHWQTPPPAGWHTSYRRTALARWIADTKYGAGHLLARVMVNRLWQHHLGRGIVATPSDFGAQGDRPSHPELLDWLADEFIRQGWQLKAIHKLIVTSAVYVQSETFDPGRAAVDPNNTLYWRRSPRRLEGEVIRDAMLAVGGMLDRRMFGPGSLDEGHRRRSIYFTSKRSQLIPLMMLFDGPDTLTSLGSRASTTTAPQAMALMNHPQVKAYGRSFAQRIRAKAGDSLGEAVRSGYRIALGRLPGDDELAEAVPFLQRQIASYHAAGKGNAPELALTDFCQALMSLNEFVYGE